MSMSVPWSASERSGERERKESLQDPILDGCQSSELYEADRPRSRISHCGTTGESTFISGSRWLVKTWSGEASKAPGGSGDVDSAGVKGLYGARDAMLFDPEGPS